MLRKPLLMVAMLVLACTSVSAAAANNAKVRETARTSTYKLRLLRHATESSSNWAGYVVGGSDATATSTSFKVVTGRWVQPKASCTAGRTTSSAFWVGLGGASDTSQSLEQVGTEADCAASGKATYSMWYELLPAASVPIKLKVFPGNLIEAFVAVQGTKVTVQIRNISRRTKFTKALRMGAPDTSSAEWIAEAPSSCNSRGRCVVLPLTNFGTMSFAAATAIGNGHHGAISDSAWTASQIELVASSPFGAPGGETATGGAVPSALSATGTSFSVDYRPAGSS